MERLTVLPSDLRTLADALRACASGVGQELDGVENAADQLRLTWEGEAQQSFDRLQTRLRSDFDGFVRALEAIAASADGYADAYGATDRAAARALGGQQ